MTSTMRLDRLIGRQVRTANGRRLGRLHECRAEPSGGEWMVLEYVVGVAGLFERLGLGVRLVLGLGRPSGYIVRWDQLDLSDAERPRLTCSIAELRRSDATRALP